MSNPLPTWLSPPDDVGLSSGTVHVWRIPLGQSASRVAQLAALLSPDEQGRVARLFFTQDKSRFTICRAVLRSILGRYLDTDPAQVHFYYGNRGKPFIAETGTGMSLHFNLTHSHELGLCAFTRDGRIGLDLEFMRPLPNAEAIAMRFFSFREFHKLSTLPAQHRHQGFFNCWTRKEAYIKATGDGLSYPLDQFEVSLAPGEPVRILNVTTDPKEAERWSLYSIMPAPQYVAALAVEGRNHQLHYWEFQ